MKARQASKKTRADRVHGVVKHCLYKEEEIVEANVPPPGAVEAQGILRTFYFHPGRLEEKRLEVVDLLKGFDDKFYEGLGGGWSFLNLCYTKEGEHWAEHRTMEELVALAIALKLAKYVMPRELWGALPGGMPYVAFNLASLVVPE